MACGLWSSTRRSRRRFAERAGALLGELPARARPFGASPLSVFLNESAGFLEPDVAGALCDAAGPDLRLTMTFCSTDSFEALVGRARAKVPERSTAPACDTLVGRARAKELLGDRSERTATFWLRVPDGPGAVRYALDGLPAWRVRRLRRAWAHGRPPAFPAGRYLVCAGAQAALHELPAWREVSALLT